MPVLVRAHARLVAMLAAFIAALALVPALPAAASPIKPSRVAVGAVVDGATGLQQPVKGQAFDISFTVVDDAGTLAPLKQATTFTVSAPDGPPLTGTTTVTLAKGATGGTISGAIYSSFGNGVVLNITGGSLAPGRITVNVLAQAYRGPKLTPGVDGGVTVSNPGCVEATSELPVCLSALVLPNGGQGFPTLSAGSCVGIVDCQGLLVEALANLKTTADDGTVVSLYTRDHPATMVIRCDKSLCGSGGVPSYRLTADVGNGFTDAPPCPSKGVISSDSTLPDFCYDTVASTRDNSGDLIAYVLFAGDVRASFK